MQLSLQRLDELTTTLPTCAQVWAQGRTLQVSSVFYVLALLNLPQLVSTDAAAHHVLLM